jgi:hypothetical protein
MPTPASLIEEFKQRKKKEKPKIIIAGNEQKPKNGCGDSKYCIEVCPILGC